MKKKTERRGLRLSTRKKSEYIIGLPAALILAVTGLILLISLLSGKYNLNSSSVFMTLIACLLIILVFFGSAYLLVRQLFELIELSDSGIALKCFGRVKTQIGWSRLHEVGIGVTKSNNRRYNTLYFSSRALSEEHRRELFTESGLITLDRIGRSAADYIRRRCPLPIPSDDDLKDADILY